MTRPNPASGRVALVTGLSRRIGIGHAITRRLLDDGASVFATGWSDHDRAMPWGVDDFDPSELDPERFDYLQADLAQPDSPARVVAATVERFGAIDILIANHARSSPGGLHDVTAAELDACWAVNARASALLVQAFDRERDRTRPDGRIMLFTSGQDEGPMDGELAYAISKGAIHQMTASLANAVADNGVTLNTINPGPVDTGYATGADHRAVADAFPGKRWGRPDDIARIVAWLVGAESGWITGQVINAEGGFRRWALA